MMAHPSSTAAAAAGVELPGIPTEEDDDATENIVEKPMPSMPVAAAPRNQQQEQQQEEQQEQIAKAGKKDNWPTTSDAHIAALLDGDQATNPNANPFYEDHHLGFCHGFRVGVQALLFFPIRALLITLLMLLMWLVAFVITCCAGRSVNLAVATVCVCVSPSHSKPHRAYSAVVGVTGTTTAEAGTSEATAGVAWHSPVAVLAASCVA